MRLVTCCEASRCLSARDIVAPCQSSRIRERLLVAVHDRADRKTRKQNLRGLGLNGSHTDTLGSDGSEFTNRAFLVVIDDHAGFFVPVVVLFAFALLIVSSPGGPTAILRQLRQLIASWRRAPVDARPFMESGKFSRGGEGCFNLS